jgi:hypothetical protein
MEPSLLTPVMNDVLVLAGDRTEEVAAGDCFLIPLADSISA